MQIETASFNRIKEQQRGLPKDGTWCFLVWKSAKDEYEWTIGGYNETEKYFYANLGLGGMIVDTDEVVAWAELFKDETFTAE